MILLVLLKDFKFLAPSLLEQVIIVQNYCKHTSHMVAQDIAVSFRIHTARPVIVELPATLPACVVYVCVYCGSSRNPSPDVIYPLFVTMQSTDHSANLNRGRR